MSDIPDIIDRLLAAVKAHAPIQRALVVSAAAEIERLRFAIRRLAEQDATLSVCDGNVTVTMDATLTDEEREAVEWFSHFGRPQNGPVIGKHAATLRGLLERLGHTGIGWKEAYDYRIEYRNVSVDSPIPPGWSWSEWIRGWRIV